MGRYGLVARGDQHGPVPGDHPAVDLHQVAEHLPGRQDIVHAVVGHGPAVADVGAVEMGRLAPLLIDPDARLPGQGIQMNATGVAAAEHVFHEDLGGAKVPFIPAGAAAEGIQLDPALPDRPALLRFFLAHL